MAQRTVLVVFAVVLLTMLAVRAQQPSQTPQPTFRAGTDLVQVDVSVLDKGRKPVRGLTVADFTVLEDGKPQPIVAFTPVDLPPRAAAVPAAAWVRDVAPDVTTNDLPDEGRLVVIMFDWSIRPEDQSLARRIAIKAVNELGPGDLAAVVFTSGFANAGVPQNFTADRLRLIDAINRPIAAAMHSPPVGPFVDRRNVNRVMLDDPEGHESGDCYCRMCSLDAMTAVADLVRSVPGRRKTVLFIGTYFQGFEDLKTAVVGRADSAPCAAPLTIARQSMVRATGLANLTVHVLDPTGLASNGNDPMGGTTLLLRERLDKLHLPADSTGGRSVINTNTPEEQVAAILDESDSYYLLGFAPGSPKADGALHHIEVKVRPKGVTVRARDGYYAPATSTTITKSGGSTIAASPVVDALSGVLPGRNVPLSVAAAAFAQRGRPESAIAIVLGGQVSVRGSDASGRPVAPEPIQVLVAALDRGGKSIGTVRQTVTIDAGGNPVRGVMPYEVLSRLDLKPGRYEIRVATDSGGDERGSVYTFVDVPDFAKEPLALSGIILETSRAVPSSGQNPLGDIVPIAPTAQRDFTTSDTVTTFLRVYQGGGRALGPVTVTTRIVDRSDHAVIDERTTIAPDRFAADRAADYEFDLPMARLAPGEYLLSIEAALDRRTERRDVRFRVR